MDICWLDKIIWYQLLIGYLYANGVGSWIIFLLMNQMRDLIKDQPRESMYSWQPPVTGIIERTLYIISFIIGRPEFIIAWLIYKITIEWKSGWNEDNKKSENDIFKGRARFSNHFNGSALSILYAFFGYLIAIHLSMETIILGVILIILSFALLLKLKRIKDKPK